MNRSLRPGRSHPLDDETPAANHMFLYALLGIVLIAFGGFVWNLYGGREPTRITPPPLAYKVAPPSGETVSAEIPEAAPVETVEDVAASDDETEMNADAATPAPAQQGAPRLTAAPRFVGNGAFVAQLAALQSEEAVAPAWARLSSRAPDLFGAARLDVERADLGQRGVYYRVRAGYFVDRTQAGLFCDRIRNMGQDCIVVSR